MSSPARPRILYIDAYDSFSNNIISLLETNLDAEVSSIRIDTPIPDFGAFVRGFAAVVAGPGPGDPRNSEDVGHFNRLWDLESDDVRPVLGICLGFQSLVFAKGGCVQPLPEPRHGLVRMVRSCNDGVFNGIPLFKTVQYHSLYATLESGRMIQGIEVKGQAAQDSGLSPLAWDSVEDQETSAQSTQSKNPARILMAVKDTAKPLTGIQFHPESICSSSAAQKVVTNWWRGVRTWWEDHQKGSMPGDPRVPQSKVSKTDRKPLSVIDPNIATPVSISQVGPETSSPEHQDQIGHTAQDEDTLHYPSSSQVSYRTLELCDLTVSLICDMLNLSKGECVVLDSEKHLNQEYGSFSIIAMIEPSSLRFAYSVATSKLVRIEGEQTLDVDLRSSQNDPFIYFDRFLRLHEAAGGQPEVPFWGGLVGYITYEACLDSLERSCRTSRLFSSMSLDKSPEHPDLSFAFVERSVVIDHFQGKVFVQSIRSNDHAWVGSLSSLLSSRSSLCSSLLPTTPKAPFVSKIALPDEAEYRRRIRNCKESIGAGDSYEICLTGKATVLISGRLQPWQLYQRLREINPAPFASYIRLGSLSLISSSPERFMKWSRPTFSDPGDKQTPTLRHRESVLQYRPIKGTVPRQLRPDSKPISLEEASSILATPKEQAENLMIVDLIRHDLHGVVGSGRVSVPKLMVVEEYRTVFQLVSVIEGRMKIAYNTRSASNLCCERKTAKRPIAAKARHRKRRLSSSAARPSEESRYESASRPCAISPAIALGATLPPGSMTGAPKLRSCQILQALEGQPRGVYSGVVGYMDVGGGGDWSVSIRNAVRWDEASTNKTKSCPANVSSHSQHRPSVSSEEDAMESVQSISSSTGDLWTVGAGGAVTALSTEDGEWTEMMAKMQATLKVFE